MVGFNVSSPSEENITSVHDYKVAHLKLSSDEKEIWAGHLTQLKTNKVKVILLDKSHLSDKPMTAFIALKNLDSKNNNLEILVIIKQLLEYCEPSNLLTLKK